MVNQKLLKQLPGVDHLLAEAEDLWEIYPKSVLVRCIRASIAALRADILDQKPVFAADLEISHILAGVKSRAATVMHPNLTKVINATGVVVHTNLGRSLLAEAAIENLLSIGGAYSNLEFDLHHGRRGSRYALVENLLCEITGAQAAMVVNNNAAAVLLCLDTLSRGKKVLVSRGELVEIGGSFRVPDVMLKSGSILVEVGTTNRTHLQDYAAAIDEQTALLLKVHKSNYQIVGFTAEVGLQELKLLGEQHEIPVMEDLGSGIFIDLSSYDMAKEPTVQESVAAGVDVITFSGDKLLGGPQAGIIVGKPDLLKAIKSNPLNRALRIDKLTLAALESTLRLYYDPIKAVQTIPTLAMLTRSLAEIEKMSVALIAKLKHLKAQGLHAIMLKGSSRAGGGALPMQNLPTRCVGIRVNGFKVNYLENFLRQHQPPIIARIEDDFLIMDLRTIRFPELTIIADALARLLKKD